MFESVFTLRGALTEDSLALAPPPAWSARRLQECREAEIQWNRMVPIWEQQHRDEANRRDHADVEQQKRRHKADRQCYEAKQCQHRHQVELQRQIAVATVKLEQQQRDTADRQQQYSSRRDAEQWPPDEDAV